MTAPEARQTDEKWRIGTSWGIHVYQGEKGSPGERPVATFHDPADAQRAVDAVNGGADTRARAAEVWLRIRQAHDWQCDCAPDDPCRVWTALMDIRRVRALTAGDPA